MTPTLPRRSFLGWTAALAGCALLTRPALAVANYVQPLPGLDGRGAFPGDVVTLTWRGVATSPLQFVLRGVDVLGRETHLVQALRLPMGVEGEDVARIVVPRRMRFTSAEVRSSPALTLPPISVAF